MTWFLESIEHKLVLNLQPFKIVAKMWTYLKNFYGQHNNVRQFQLELELANLKQDSLFIFDFYFSFMNFLTKYIDIVFATLPHKSPYLWIIWSYSFISFVASKIPPSLDYLVILRPILLFIFLDVCYVHLPTLECTKLMAQFVQCDFLRYFIH
jgi:hypothetical protein